MPALMWIDAKTGSDRSRRFLEKGGLWQAFTADKLASKDAWEIDVCQDRFWRVMKYCEDHFIDESRSS